MVTKRPLSSALVSTLVSSLESTVINSVDDYTTIGGSGVETFTPEDLFTASGDPGIWYQYYLTPEQQVWRRNLYDQTENLTSNAWTFTALTVAPSLVLAPDGTATAFELIGGPDPQQQALSQNINAETGVQSQYIYAKADTLPRISLTSFDGSSYVLKTVFDLLTGTVVSNNEGIATITDEGNGWWLCKVEGFNMTGLSGGNMFQFRPARATDTDGQTSGPFLPGADTVLIWHPQREMGAVATPYQPITAPEQSFINAFPEAHLFQDETCRVPVTALNQPIFICVDQSQPRTELVGTWAQTAGDALVSVVGDTITVTGGTTSTDVTFTGSPVGSVTYYQIEEISGDGTQVDLFCGGAASGLLLSGKNYYTGRNPVTGINILRFPAGANHTLKVGPVMHSNTNTWKAASAAARPLYGLINGGPTVGAIWDGVDDVGESPTIDFSGTDKMNVYVGARPNPLLNVGMMIELSTNANNNAFFLASPRNSPFSGDIGARSAGSIWVEANSAIDATPLPMMMVISSSMDIANDVNVLSVNAVQVASNSGDQGIGNFSNNPLFIGGRAGTALPFNGAITDVVVIGRTTTPLETLNTEDFINDNLGAF